MGCMNSLVFCWIIVFGFLIPVNGIKNVAKGVQTFRFTKIECWTSGITLLPKYQCFIKPYSRTYATANINWKFNRPLTDFKVNFTMDYKYVTTYRATYTTKNVDFCSVMSNKSMASAFFEMIFNTLRESGLGNILHHCPYNEVIAYNFTISGETVFSVFPSGDYRCI